MISSKDHIAQPLTLGLLITGFCAYWIGTVPNNILPLEISAYIEHYSLSEPIAGTMATVESLFVVFATFVLARRVQILPTVRMALIGSAIALIGQIIPVYVEAGAMLWISRVASGIGFGIILAIANVLISQSENPDRFYAILWAAAAIFDTLLFMVVPLFVDEFGHPGLFILVSILILAGAIFMLRLPQVQDVSVEETKEGEANRAAGIILIVAVFVLFTALGGLWSFAEQIMANNFGMDNTQSGLILALSVLAGFCGATVASWIADKISRQLLIYMGIAITVGCSLVATQTSDALTFNITFITYVGLVYFLIPLLLGLAASLAASGEYAAMVSGMVVIGTSLGPMIGGVLVEQYGYSALGMYYLIIAIITVIALTTVVFRKHSTVDGQFV